MSLALDCVCDKLDRLAHKWRPFVNGRQKMKVALTRTDTGEPVGVRMLTTADCYEMCWSEMLPLVEEALRLAKK